jgi:hypothetical protein
MPAEKRQGIGEDRLNQGKCRLSVIKVPKRLNYSNYSVKLHLRGDS